MSNSTDRWVRFSWQECKVQRFRFVLSLAAASIATGLATVALAAGGQLTGAGSSFDFPFFSRAFYEYGKLHSDVQVNYQSIGSGGGIQQFTAKTVDFGASDVPLTANEMKVAQASNGDVVQVPVALGGVVVAYNVPGVSGHLKLDQQALTGIFMGKIMNWNDAAIAKLNPGTNLPNQAIVVAHRADGSGTTYIFTDYMSKISPDWKIKVGTAKTVNWPSASAIGAKGNEGVAGLIRQTPGAIGYVELAYALQNDIAYASLRNSAGQFVLPSVDSVRAAASQKPKVSPSDYSIVDMGGADSYPIAGYSWVMLWKNQSDPNKGKTLVDLFRWIVTDGQTYAANVKYVSLPKNVQSEADAALSSIKT
jgi:phosphate transport system substrate-binding protein